MLADYDFKNSNNVVGYVECVQWYYTHVRAQFSLSRSIVMEIKSVAAETCYYAMQRIRVNVCTIICQDSVRNVHASFCTVYDTMGCKLYSSRLVYTYCTSDVFTCVCDYMHFELLSMLA